MEQLTNLVAGIAFLAFYSYALCIIVQRFKDNTKG